MNSTQLTNAVMSDRLGQNLFRGVFPADELTSQNVIDYPCGYIANTDPSHKPGTHWVCFFFDKNKKGEFFCSYGKPPKDYKFETWLANNSKTWTFNETRLQGALSSVCGQFCIFYLLHRFRDTTIDGLFSKDFDLNDKWVNDFIAERFNMDTAVINTDFLKTQIAKAFTGQF